MLKFGKKHPEPAGLPLVLINGWAPFALPLHVVRRQYENRGFSTTVIPYRPSDMHDLEAFGDHVAIQVLRYCQENNLRQVNLMGISLGGVAGMLALKRHGIAPSVATFASVGAPLLGTPLSLLAISSGLYWKLGWQLRPHNRFLTRLSREELPAGPRYVAIAGAKDYTCPPWSALFPGATNIVLPFGHGGVLGHPAIPEAVAPHLARMPSR